MPRRVLGALVAISALLAVLLAAELVLRLTMADRLATLFRVDEDHLHDLRPGARKVSVRSPINGGEAVLTEINSQGFRGPELADRASVRRIVVYGDSCIQASFSHADRTYVGRLAAELADLPGAPVEVVNAGVIGFGPDQIALRLPGDLALLRPDLVIVALFADNDLGDPIRNKLFRLDANGALADNQVTIDPRLVAAFERAQSDPLVWKLALKLRDRILLAAGGLRATFAEPATLYEIELGLRELEQRNYVGAEGAIVRDVMGDGYDADVSLRPDSEFARYKVALLGRILERIAGEVRDAGARLLVLVIPSRLDLEAAASPERIDRANHPDYRPETLSRTVGELAARVSAPSVNLYDLFASDGGLDNYWREDDNHWNDAGQASAARRTARVIREQALLP